MSSKRNLVGWNFGGYLNFQLVIPQFSCTVIQADDLGQGIRNGPHSSLFSNGASWCLHLLAKPIFTMLIWLKENTSASLKSNAPEHSRMKEHLHLEWHRLSEHPSQKWSAALSIQSLLNAYCIIYKASAELLRDENMAKHATDALIFLAVDVRWNGRN